MAKNDYSKGIRDGKNGGTYKTPTDGGSFFSNLFDSDKTSREKINRNDDYRRGYRTGRKKRR